MQPSVCSSVRLNESDYKQKESLNNCVRECVFLADKKIQKKTILICMISKPYYLIFFFFFFSSRH